MNKNSLFMGWAVFYYPILFGLYLCCLPVMARTPLPKPILQQYTITGTVRDSQGVLPGVTVSVQGKSTATITDYQGKYGITATATDILVFSFVGYTTLNIPIAGRTIVSVHLQEDATQLQEVRINAGYYSVKESERTGSIARITAKAIETQPVTNVLATMQGRMAGVNIVQESGIAGGGFSISIRGLNSLREGANAPLFIIDGVPYSSDPISDRQTSTSIPGDGNPLGSINPSDIESLEILKDADATAIYGSRGANGVVLITTKKGKAGKTTFTINSSHGSGRVSKIMPLMNTEQYLLMRREAFATDGITTYPANAYDVNGTWDPSRYTDWQKKLTGGTSEVMGLQATVGGGSEQTKYLLSGNYRTESSVFPGDFLYTRGGARLSFDHVSEDKKFHITFSGSYTVQHNDLPWTDFVTLSRQLAPNAPALYDANNKLNWENSTWENPLANLESKNIATTSDLIANSLLSYRVAKNLEFKTSLGFTDLHNEDNRSIPSTVYDPAYNLGSQYSSIYSNTVSKRSWIVEPQLNWRREYGQSKIDVLLGASYQNQDSKKLLSLASGFTSNSLLNDLSSASVVQLFNNDAIYYKYQAFFGRANYTFADKYIVNFTGRRDGSSRFGPGKQFATFGAIGGAWLFYKEPLLAENSSWLSFGKLRSSYGTTGNDQIGDYQFLNTYSSSGYQYGGTNGLQPARLYNADFGWETNKKFEAGLELGFFNDRIFLTTAWYQNRSSNQLVGLPLAGTTGFSSIQANLDATVENTGFEATLRLVPIKTNNFSWTTNFNVTRATNKLISFPGLAASSYRSDYVIGAPTTIKKLFHFTGVDPQTGVYQFKDVNGDGAISFEDDRETVKDFNPKYYGGLQNLFVFKGLQLDFLFQFVKQENFNFAATQRFAGLLSNQPSAYVNSWHQAGDLAPYQRYTTGTDQQVMQASEYFGLSDGAVSDASYIRLKNISLSYDFSRAFLPQVGCRLSLQAQNLLTITSYKGADPEFTQGGSLPPLRVVSVGIQLTF
ncbi:SusC/RagA family TonB-linked outer membrane protein [Flavobacterium hiemivividum]|uniref:SusC/RagA family TonB-linked outer membrane protein n=1 Tax=Flavobacterium hiemivividum TaxID=2541734 RepID=A0A4R5CX56_9FLAO|nr:SusC/RagA family TonB-linked outer membrane protein [Flavobacterium hiemivividum]TDE05372.1 SusC/RagA family TonB-linked outer membrane protein [Flavobacterium hiemivividum]